ncbi:TRAP transporter small permease [Ruegeria litorea]|uniref:TRAP transporter small permease protein n=1 Tax=Falsiruegeria litorea TaxID=1280831 RepID=A0ABS5WL68_9RHOB|nr:TRAP transporter small permease [Falsiruegeria litorea]MBT3139486.1 TRAP transporter small permease [Falsiruegeria litorea]
MQLSDRLPPTLGTTVRRMIAVKQTIAAVATLILPITFFMVVLFRYFLHFDLFAYEEWLLPIGFWLFFLGSAVGSYQDTQIRADVFESYFKSTRSIWLRELSLHVIEAVIATVMAYWAWLMIINDLGMYPWWQKTIALKIPHFVPHLGIFLGMAFMAFYSTLHIFVLLKFGPAVVDEDYDNEHPNQEA